MKKDALFRWDERCQKAFNEIKSYLLAPPVLTAPIQGRPLILYITALEGSLGALLGQVNDQGVETACYYLSKALVPAEHNYKLMEKVCLALSFTISKLRHYLLAHSVRLISKADPLKFLLRQPVLTGSMGKWAMQMGEYDLYYVPLKAFKGQAVVDFLAAHPLPTNSPLMDLDEDVSEGFEVETPFWSLYFDGAVTREKSGAGVILITPQGNVIPYSFALERLCTNNMAEYEALVIGLKLALGVKAYNLLVLVDLELVIRQITSQYEVREDHLASYCR